MKKRTGLIAAIIAVLLLAIVLSQGLKKNEKITKTDFALNTVVEVSIYDKQDEALLDKSLELCDRYEQLFSRTFKGSEIYELNKNGGGAVSDETRELIEKGLYYSELSEGAFDVTVGPLTSLWNFTSENPSVPKVEEIKEAANHVDYRKVKVEGNFISFEEPGMAIDLGAIAKGYIADRMKEFLISEGVESAVISLGGNVLCIGDKPEGEEFTIGIQKPYKDRDEVVASMKIRDLSVVSSGIYERFFEVDGKQYHHILNPATGYPYDNQLVAVTIVSPDSVDGDALSTTCYSMGLEKGMNLIDSLDGVYGLFITKDYEIHYSKGMKEAFSITD